MNQNNLFYKKEIYKYKIIFAFIAACITVCAFSISVKPIDYEVVENWARSNNYFSIVFAEIRYLMAGYGILNAVLTACLTVYYYKSTWRCSLGKCWNIILAIFFAACMVFGQAFQADNSWELLFGKKIYILMFVVKMLGYSIFFYSLINWLNIIVERKFYEQDTIGKVTFFFFEKHSFLGPFIFIVISWLPYLIACYPGVVQWDGLRQLENYSHLAQSDNSHPVFTTLLMGICMDIGKAFGNDNLGVFFYILPQFLINALVFAYTIHFIKRFKTPYMIRWGILFFFSFISLWPLYAVSLFKDTLYYIVFLCYTLINIQIMMEGDSFWHNKKKPVCLVCTAVLLCLIRPNGIYVVFLSMPFWIILFTQKRVKIKMVVLIVLIAMLVKGFNGIIVPGMGVAPGRKQEAYCVLMQQTARYVKEYGDEVTSKEKKAIAAVMDYESLEENYNPEFADPVKKTFNENLTEEEFSEYLHVWLAQFLKHPGVYFESFLNGCYGYFYPNKTEYREGLGAYWITYDPGIYSGKFDIHMLESLLPLREILENASYIVRQVPVIGLLFSNGIYTWILVILMVLLVNRGRWKYLIVFIPAILTILICCVSPVNAYIRYMRPVMVVMPVLVAWILYVINMKKHI